MGNNLEVGLKITADAQGAQAGLKQLGEELRALGEEAGVSGPELQALAGQLDELARKQGLVDAFRHQKKALREAEQALEAAQARAQSLGRELAKTDGPAKSLQQNFERARQAARRHSESVRRQREELQRLRNTMAEAGIATRNLSSHQRQLNQTAESLRARIDALRGGIEEADRTGSRFGLGFRKRLESISDRLRRTHNAMLTFFAAHVGMGLAKRLADSADQWKSISARVREATDSEAEFNLVQNELFRISQQTRSSLAANSNLYARIAGSIKRMGGNEEDALAVTETLTKLLQLQGATSEEVASATLQFSQAIGSGVLRGEEFNAIYEASPRAIKALADGLGLPVEKMRQLAAAGELTADRVIGGLLRQRQAVDKAYAKLPLTVGGALQQLENRWLKLLGTQDEATGASRQVAEAVQAVARNLDSVVAGAVVAGNAVTIVARSVVALFGGVVAMGLKTLDALTFNAIDAIHARAEAASDTVKALVGDIEQDAKDIKSAWKSIGHAADQSAQRAKKGAGQAAAAVRQLGDEAEQTGIRFKRLNTEGLDADFKILKLDVERFRSGMTTAGKEAVAAFGHIAKASESTQEQIRAAFAAALDASRSRAAIEALKQALRQAAAEGRLSGEALRQGLALADDKLARLTRQARELPEAFADAEVRLKTLFGDSDAALQHQKRQLEATLRAMDQAFRHGDYQRAVQLAQKSIRLNEAVARAEKEAADKAGDHLRVKLVQLRAERRLSRAAELTREAQARLARETENARRQASELTRSAQAVRIRPEVDTRPIEALRKTIEELPRTVRIRVETEGADGLLDQLRREGRIQ